MKAQATPRTSGALTILPAGLENVSDIAPTKFDEVRSALLLILLEEYKTIRTEILARVAAQQNLTQYAVILIGASLPYSTVVIERQEFVALLVVPLILIPLCWLFLREDTMIMSLSTYVSTELGPNIKRVKTETLASFRDITVLDWETFRARTHFRSGTALSLFHRFLAFIRYYLSLGPSIGAIVAFYVYMNSRPWHAYDYALFTIDIVLVCFTIYLTLWWVTQPPSVMMGENFDDAT